MPAGQLSVVGYCAAGLEFKLYSEGIGKFVTCMLCNLKADCWYSADFRVPSALLSSSDRFFFFDSDSHFISDADSYSDPDLSNIGVASTHGKMDSSVRCRPCRRECHRLIVYSAVNAALKIVWRYLMVCGFVCNDL